MNAVLGSRARRSRTWAADRWAGLKRRSPFPSGRAGRRGWAVAAAALVVSALMVAVSAVAFGTGARAPVVDLGIVGWVLLAVAVLWRPAVLTPALFALALPPVLVVANHSHEQPVVIALAPLLVATGELAGWSFDLRSVVPETRRVTARRLVDIAILTVGAAVVAGAVLAVSGLPAPGGILPLLAGAGATLAIVALATVRRW